MQLARLVTACALVPLVLGACYRDRPPGGAPENRSDPARTAASNDELAFLPLDAEVVLGLDARQVFASPLWKLFEPQVTERIGTELAGFRAACGYDPFQTLRGVTMGFKTGEPIEGVFVVRGLDRDKTMACIARVPSQEGQLVVEGRIITIPADADGPTVVMTFANASTLVIATSRGKLEAALTSGAPLRGSRAFLELWALVDAKQAVWGIVNGASSAFNKLSTAGVRPRAVLGSVALSNGLSMSARMRLGTADEATQLAVMGQAQLGAVKSLVQEIALDSEGPDVMLRVAMTTPQVQMLAQLMMGAMGGMGIKNPLGGP